MRKFMLILLALCAAPLATAHAQVETYTFDTPHTQVMFSVMHMGLTNSTGKFLDYKGTVVLDRTNMDKSSVNVTIKTPSLDLSDVEWDNHVKDKNFLDVSKYPTMTFISKSVTVTGDKTAKVLGDLTLHGVTKPVTLDVVYNAEIKDPYSNEMKAGFSATTAIKRSEFGMTTAIPMVGDEVKIMIEAELIKQDDEKDER